MASAPREHWDESTPPESEPNTAAIIRRLEQRSAICKGGNLVVTASEIDEGITELKRLQDRVALLESQKRDIEEARDMAVSDFVRLQARVVELERLVAANATKNISLIGDKQLLQARVAELEAETRELTAYIRENEHMD